jgi:CheY-like chemotaxis protein
MVDPKKEPNVGAEWDDRQAGSSNVIVIEDEPVVQMLLQEMLTELGFTSSAFEDAVQALNYLMQTRGDCTFIIADQGLPGGMKGTEFICMAHKMWPSIPTILTSGYYVDVQDIPSFATYLHKPYTLVQLEQTILPLLRQPPQRPS